MRNRIEFNMDFGWRFHKGEPSDSGSLFAKGHSTVYNESKAGNATGGAKIVFNDFEWREVDLPHDYLFESEIGEEYLQSSGYREPDNAWYRKTFRLQNDLKDKALTLCFEGTAMDAEFYFNGSLLARSFSAYTETVFDITDRAYFDDRPNVLAVHINGFKKYGWWYEGAGIYRHVKLFATDPLHIERNGIFAKPVLSDANSNTWTVDLTTACCNRYDFDTAFSVRATLYDGEKAVVSGESAVTEAASLCSAEARQALTVQNPILWDVDSPKLYTLKAEIVKDGEVVDADTVRIGFRTFCIDPDKGFFLNGRHLKIKGAAAHQDHACVGAAVPDRVQRYRIEQLKKMGCNAYRCAHHHHSTEILDACDEIGLLVMDENRIFETGADGLSYLETMVKCDRNHPSVVFYSLFNEEPLQSTQEGARMYCHMKGVVKRLDGTRLVTGAVNSFEPYEGAGACMDVLGINYGLFDVANIIERSHEIVPHLPIIGSENNSATTMRGYYQTDREKHILSCYDEEKVSWGATVEEMWKFTRENDYYAGLFVWTGFDYHGEPSPLAWPTVNSCFGAMDTCGFPKASFYFHKACFTDPPFVKLIPHWNFEKGKTVRVVAITNCEEAELFLNGVSLGKKAADATAQPEWQVPFEPGCLLAKGYRSGEVAACDEKHTVGTPKTVRAEMYGDVVTDNGQDVVIVNCSVLDENGHEVEFADNLLHVEVTGDGVLLGVENGNQNSHESAQSPQIRLFNGKCQAIVRVFTDAKALCISVSGDGLETAEVRPKIRHVPRGKRINSVRNCNIRGVTQSVITKERPDPLVKLAEDDMNSFTPVELSESRYPKDFTFGWRIYRLTPTLFDTEMRLRFYEVRAAQMEVYVDNARVYVSNGEIKGKVFCDFVGKKGDMADIRILLKAIEGVNCGIVKAIQLLSVNEKEEDI